MNWWDKVKEFPGKVREFLKEVRAEMGKTYFPSWDEVKATTLVVIITSVLFAIYLFIADFAIIKTIEGIFSWAS